MKKIFTKCLFFIPILILIISTNFFIDPLHKFNTNPLKNVIKNKINQHYLSNVSEMMKKGYNVTNFNPIIDRDFQKYIIENNFNRSTKIVLGSSRTQLIQKDTRDSIYFRNSSVHNASIQDIVAIYRLFEEKKYNINKIILGIDPLMLMEDDDATEWRSLENEFRVMYNKIMPFSENSYLKYNSINNLKILISLTYFKNTISYLIHMLKKDYFFTKETENTNRTLLQNGAMVSAKDIIVNKEKTETKTALKAENIIQIASMYNLNNMSKLSDKKKMLIKSFINYLKKKNIKIEIFLGPFHPIVYKYFNENRKFKGVILAEKFVGEIAKENSIKIVGSYNPSKFKLTSDYFSDGIHPNQKCINYFFNQ